MSLVIGGILGNLLPGDTGHHHHHHNGHQHHHHHGDHSLGLSNHHGDHSEHPSHHHSQHIEHKESESERKGRSDIMPIDFTKAVYDAESGQDCVKKERVLKSVTKVSLLTCYHSLVSVCYTSLVTNYKHNREELCEEYYAKQCNIVFNKIARNKTVQHCYRPVQKQCQDNKTDTPTCTDILETECSTQYNGDLGHAVCRRVPRTLCSDSVCQYEEGDVECHDKIVAVVNDIPEESCDLVPKKICRSVYRLLPYLKQQQQCEEVPRQVCTYGVKNTGPGDNIRVTKWCLDDEVDNDITVEQAQNTVDIDDNKEDEGDTFRKYETELDRLVLNNVNRKEEFFFGELSNPKSDIIERTESQLLLPPPISNSLRKKGKSKNRIPRKRIDPRHIVPDVKYNSSLISLLDTVKQDPEGSEEFVTKIFDSQPNSEADKVVRNYIPEVFKFRSDKKDKFWINDNENRQGRNTKIKDEWREEDFYTNVEKNKAKAHPAKFESIVSKLNKADKMHVKIEKVKRKKLETTKAIASVIKHKNKDIAQTVVIHNTPEAHRVFGVRNIPQKFLKSIRNIKNIKHSKDTSEQSEIIGYEGRESSNLVFPDENMINIERRAITTREKAISTLPEELETHLTKQKRPTKDVNSITDDHSTNRFISAKTNLDKEKSIYLRSDIDKNKFHNEKHSRHQIKFKPENNIAPPLFLLRSQDDRTRLVQEELSVENYSSGVSSQVVDENDIKESTLPTKTYSLPLPFLSKIKANNTTFTEPNSNLMSEKPSQITTPKTRRGKEENFNSPVISPQTYKPLNIFPSEQNDYKKSKELSIKNKKSRKVNPRLPVTTPGYFKPPSTLLFGFQPITTTTTARPEPYHNNHNIPHTKHTKQTLISQVQTFLQPLTSLISR